ncbi:hypothetical protein L227DRAFT_466941, partial [Lentinus tigrinus ALCF2SS1-6]
RHPDYYFEDGNLTILVDDVLFKLHRAVLASGASAFTDRFSHHDGGSDEWPLPLSGTRVREFAMFLSVIYPASRAGTLKSHTLEEWIVILDQSYKWGCSAGRAMAVEYLQSLSMDHVLKIAIWKKYELGEAYIIPSYHAICIRQHPLSAAEGKLLGLDAAVRLAAMRDKV